jgi:hypothetical protein
MKTSVSALPFAIATLLAASSLAQAPRTTVITPVPAAAPGSDVGISSKDGISLSGTDVLITRNGLTEKLTKALELPNGMRVLPDGTIVARDGGKVTLRATQILTFEGQLIEAPIRESAAPASTTTTTTTTTGTAPAPATPTIVIEKPAVTKQAADEAARVEAERREKAASKGPIKAGEGVQK